jgi:hypothetical protein
MRAMSVERIRARWRSPEPWTRPGRWLLVAACAVGCKTTERADRDVPAPAASSAAAPSATSSAAGAAAPPPAPAGIEGKWEGRYDAKRGTVLLPPKVKDKALAADDGKTAVGQGAVEVSILANGDVTGKMSGPLGAATITGKVDGSALRAGVRPDDLSAPNAMSGIFTGERKGETFACELRVAGPDGTMIRESTVELRRKK